MKGFNRLTLAVAAVSLLAVPAVYAAPASISSPVHAMFGKTKAIGCEQHEVSSQPVA